jgi:hypothetical protein
MAMRGKRQVELLMLARDGISPRPLATTSAEVVFHPHSFADDAGRLFWAGGQLLRGIYSEHAPFFARLFRDGVIESLVERGLLIESEPTGQSMDGCGMVVSHRAVPFVSYPNEWCAAMLKDAALTIIDLTIELTRRGLTLKDAHPWNLLFDATRPVYVDLTSIATQREVSGWPAYDEFCRFCYYPLILMSHGHERIARTLLPEYEGVLRTDLMTIMRGSAPSMFVLSRLLKRGSRLIRSAFKKEVRGRQPALAFLERVRRDLENIQLPARGTVRQGRRDEPALSISSQAGWTAQQRTLRDILAELQPCAVLDLSRGERWTSTLPALMGYNVVSVDADPARSASIYETARAEGLPILPLVIDFIKPTPSVGYSSHYSIAATERLKCDMVLAFGLAHKIARDNHFSFDLIAEGLSAFSKRWLVVEFAPRESRDGDEAVGKPASRTLDDFINALRKRFNGVRTLPHGAEPGVLLLCEK